MAKRKAIKKEQIEDTEKEEKKVEMIEEEELEDDPFLEKLTLIFLLVFLLLVIFIPGDWFNSLSIWVRNNIPGLN